MPVQSTGAGSAVLARIVGAIIGRLRCRTLRRQAVLVVHVTVEVTSRVRVGIVERISLSGTLHDGNVVVPEPYLLVPVPLRIISVGVSNLQILDFRYRFGMRDEERHLLPPLECYRIKAGNVRLAILTHALNLEEFVVGMD